MLSLNKNWLIFVFQLIYWGNSVTATNSLIGSDEATKTVNTVSAELSDVAKSIKGDYNSINEHKDSTENLLDRKKRWITTGFCLNYPLCCDQGGKDVCSFYCPVCPIKRDYCKSIPLILIISLSHYSQMHNIINVYNLLCFRWAPNHNNYTKPTPSFSGTSRSTRWWGWRRRTFSCIISWCWWGSRGRKVSSVIRWGWRRTGRRRSVSGIIRWCWRSTRRRRRWWISSAVGWGWTRRRVCWKFGKISPPSQEVKE